ncbi:hypothetical protein MNB_SV-13-1515 [hydrothermal vent metagenome]|uniref:DAGKc domain-containing protein n=1 Tax=hydrothermal vent metagenome TaxID=652676 RepID=A0A1W1D075_9ZZZZ
MHLLSIGKTITHETLSITSIEESMLPTHQEIEKYHYIIIHGGDGTIRRIVTILHQKKYQAKIILNPTGSFNVIAKLHRVPKLESVLNTLLNQQTLPTKTYPYASLNQEIFLFSAGNMGDLQHIFLAETLRFGILKKGMAKYMLSIFFLFPLHLIMTPFMLLSPRRFFIFTPMPFIKKVGSFYGEVKAITINLKNNYNLIELDGDIVTIQASILEIKPAGEIEIVCG